MKYLSYRESLSTPAGWVVYSAVPLALLTGSLVRSILIHSLFLAITVAGVLLLLRLLIRQRLSDPIRRLSTYLENWDTRAGSEEMPKKIAGNTHELALIVEAARHMTARVRETTEQLEKSEQLFRTVTEFALDWAYWLSPAGELQYISPASERITGFSKQEFYRNPELLFSIVHPEDRNFFFAHAKQAVAGKAHDPLEFRIINKEGKSGWISHVCRGVYGANGDFQGVRGSNTDVTQQKIAEAVLRESEERFRTLFEQAADGIFVHDLEGRMVDVNQQACEMLGYSKEELLRLSVFEMDTRADRERLPALWYHLTPGATKSLEGMHRKKDGALLPVEIRLAPVFWGENRYILALVRDISERYRAQAELAREKELLDTTLRSIGDGVICTDLEGRVIIFNRMAEVLTGWQEKEALGRTLSEVFYRYHEESGKECFNPIGKIHETGKILTIGPCVLVTRTGEKRLIMDSSAPISNQEGFKGTVIVFRDITEQRKLEQEALRADKLESLGILAGGIAHDFNNLLTAVLGNLSLAKMHVDPRSNVINHLNAAEKASLRTRDLTQQLLTFARGGAPIKETTSIGDLIKDSAHFVLRGSNVRLQLSLAPDLWPVEVDPGQMNQVINNLIINSDQAMPEGGLIEVRAENVLIEGEDNLPLVAGRYVRVVIRDHGVGIPAVHLSNIFDPYFTTKQQGSGLGLASSYSIVKRHGGHIKVESEVGEGTTFTVYIPAGQQPARKEAPAEEETLEGHGKILVMDDDAMVRQLSGELLGHLGFEVDFATDGEEAVAMYREALEANAPYRLVIMDLTIPGGMGGKEAVRKVLELDPGAKALVSSGFAQDQVVAEYERYGFSGKLTKPYNIREVVRTISRLLEDGNREVSSNS
mgnify:CR=1 FL=1